MNSHFDIVAIGELLIDFTPLKAAPGKVAYELNPGGAPANVLVAAQKLGKKTALIAKVGNDIFGKFLKDTVEKEGINTKALIVSDDYSTTLAFVTLNEFGDRRFDFLRKNSADVMMTEDDLDDDILSNCDIFHFGAVSLTTELSRRTTFAAVKRAKQAGAIISYDPNYRPPLWKNVQEAKKIMREGFQYADVVKIADDELKLIFDESNYLDGAKRIVSDGAKFAFVTLGPEGCCFATAYGDEGYVPGFKVNTVDTTGAGDTFTGVILSKLHDCNFLPSSAEIDSMVKLANAAGALNTTKRGAIPAMPSEQDIETLLYKNALIS